MTKPSRQQEQANPLQRGRRQLANENKSTSFRGTDNWIVCESDLKAMDLLGPLLHRSNESSNYIYSLQSVAPVSSGDLYLPCDISAVPGDPCATVTVHLELHPYCLGTGCTLRNVTSQTLSKYILRLTGINNTWRPK